MSAFISYTWESEEHRTWVREFAARLRGDGVDVTLDQWHLQPGDQVPVFMERAVRENDYVIIVCTPRYQQRSNERLGGVGYEGDIMTAEVLTERNHRKFIPVFRLGNDWAEAAPRWLLGKYYVDFRGSPYSDAGYQDLITTLHGLRTAAPAVGNPPLAVLRTESRAQIREEIAEAPEFQPILILGIVVDQITQPRMDGTKGSALYTIPFQLSRRPSSDWRRVFIERWNRPRSWTSMHRPGIASILGDKVYLEGTTVEEVEKYHRYTLKLALEDTNAAIEEHERNLYLQDQKERARREQHVRAVQDAARRINFD